MELKDEVRELVDRIKTRTNRFPEREQRLAFSRLVVQPPCDAHEDKALRSRKDEAEEAFWDGFDGRTIRSELGSERATAHAAGRYRRDLELRGLLPRSPNLQMGPQGIVESTPVNRFIDDAGFVASRKADDDSHYVLYDRQRGADWLGTEERWIVCRYLEDGTNTGIVGFPTKAFALETMRAAASPEGPELDFGQIDGMPRP